MTSHFISQSSAAVKFNRDQQDTAKRVSWVTCCTGAVVDTTGSTANFTDLLNQAVSAIGGYRSVVQDQLPAPVSSLNDLKGVNGLDTALAARAATYVIQQLGENKYQQACTFASSEFLHFFLHCGFAQEACTVA